jgi:hypothetical protein
LKDQASESSGAFLLLGFGCSRLKNEEWKPGSARLACLVSERGETKDNIKGLISIWVAHLP